MKDLFAGLAYLREGFALLGRPGLRRFVIMPLLVNVLLFGGLTVGLVVAVLMSRSITCNGSRASPLRATASPPAKATVTSSGVSGASSGDAVSLNMSAGGSLHGSSRMPPS